MSQRIAVIMAGGSGERFWPLSRRQRPKQLLRLSSDLSMIEEAVERALPLVSAERLWIATSTELIEGMRQALPQLPAENIFAEPARRNTAGCLTWVAAQAAARFPGENPTLLTLTADHKIGEPDLFRAAMSAGMDHAEQSGALVTFGVNPTRAETGYGYIECGKEIAQTGAGPLHQVIQFREKPDATLAREFVESGRFAWNSGMFCWTLDAFNAALAKVAPPFAEALPIMAGAIESDDDDAANEAFEALPGESIDNAVMERSANIATLRVSFPWDDVGEWSALARLAEANSEGNILQGEAVLLDSEGCIAYNLPAYEDEAGGSAPPIIAGVGLENMIVVATGDAVLILPRDRAQDVKKIVAELKQRRSDLT